MKIIAKEVSLILKLSYRYHLTYGRHGPITAFFYKKASEYNYSNNYSNENNIIF